MYASQQTNSGALPQLQTLESASADTLRVSTKRGADVSHDTAGVQHGRGESKSGTRTKKPGLPSHRETDGRGTSPAYVLVLDKNKKPLAPCHPATARRLLQAGRARVHCLEPFTIRIVDRVVADSNIPILGVGIDPGSKVTGIAVFQLDKHGNRKGIWLGEICHRGPQIKSALYKRACLRRGRRTRNLRYREPRFLNRRRPEGWLPPSLRHRVDTTLSWVRKLRNCTPFQIIYVELVRFDTQMMQNPEISGVEYQQGTLAGYEVREYLLEKWRRRCAYCDVIDVPLNIDHAKAKACDGSNRVSNLVLACIPCNDAKDKLDIREFVKDPKRLARILSQMKVPLHDAAAVNATRWELDRKLRELEFPVIASTGGMTKWNRKQFDIPKTHALDAFCVGDVAGVARWPRDVLEIKCSGRGQYARTKMDKYGFPRSKFPRKKMMHGFITGDLVSAVVSSGKKVGRRYSVTNHAGTHRMSHHIHRSLYCGKMCGWGKLFIQPTPTSAI